MTLSNNTDTTRVEMPTVTTCRKNKPAGTVICCVTHRWTVTGIALLELLISSVCTGLLLYTGQNFQEFKQILHLPNCLTDKIAVGLINSLSLLCGIECILAAWLMDAINRNKVHQIRYWLIILVTYETVMLTFIICLGLAGCTTDELNSFSFFRVLFRFVEFVIIFAYAEHQILKRMRLKTRAIRQTLRRSTNNNSNATSYSNISLISDISQNGYKEEDQLNSTQTS